MKFARLSDTTHALRLERGDDIHEIIQAFCAENSIALAHYSVETKQFTERQFTGIFEITSLLGNIALLNEGIGLNVWDFEAH